ncbi:MAG: hypothetical protein ACTTKZ_02825 [Bacteroides sp.]
MPYRRLPNTDQARIRAMRAAYKMGRETHPTELAFTQSTYTKLELFINSFEQAIQQYQEAYRRQSESSALYQPVAQKARLYVSHFIQVVNMAVQRGELKPSIRAYYSLPLDEAKLPSLVSDQEVIDWGQKIIQGEFQRTSEGKPPIMNPTIALVKVQYEKFVEIYTRHRVLQQNTTRTRGDLEKLRATADQIILAIWDEVEDYFGALPAVQAREHASQYGLVYIFRKTEIHETPLFSEEKPTP